MMTKNINEEKISDIDLTVIGLESEYMIGTYGFVNFTSIKVKYDDGSEIVVSVEEGLKMKLGDVHKLTRTVRSYNGS